MVVPSDQMPRRGGLHETLTNAVESVDAKYPYTL